jgi:hypothetical protein
VATVIATLIHVPVCTLIEVTVFPSIQLPILTPIFPSVQLSVFTTILSAIQLTIFSPISLAIFLPNIRLGEHHIRQDGWGCHSDDQAGNRSGFQQMVLHDAYSFCEREWVIRVSFGCYWARPTRLSHLVPRSNQPVTE